MRLRKGGDTMENITVMVKHKVKDYAEWKKVFDEHDSFRKDGGELSYQLYRKEGEADTVYLLFTWESRERAEKFLQSESLREAMAKAGVIEKPDIALLEKVEEVALV